MSIQIKGNRVVVCLFVCLFVCELLAEHVILLLWYYIYFDAGLICCCNHG